MDKFEEEISQKLSTFIEEWNKKNPAHILSMRPRKLQGVCSWDVDFVIDEIEESVAQKLKIAELKRTLAIIEVKSCAPKSSRATHKQHLDRAFVELYDLKFNAPKEANREVAKLYLLLRGVRLDAIHDYGKLFQSIGVNVFHHEDLDAFFSDIERHVLTAVETPLHDC